jgi:DNA-binding MarR family transcriptional regulator
MRMRDMEQAGFIEAVSGKDDARSKYLMPTERFYESIYSHAEQVKKIFDRKFLLIEK